MSDKAKPVELKLTYDGSAHDQTPVCVMGLVNRLDECAYILNLLSQQEYNRGFGEGVSAIGAHMRHILEYVLALKGMQAGDTINYDARKRDKNIQTDIRCAQAAISQVKEFLGGITRDDMETEVWVIEAVDEHIADEAVLSTLGREIVSVCHHAVHHHDDIKDRCKLLGKCIPMQIGIAAGTLRDMRKTYG